MTDTTDDNQQNIESIELPGEEIKKEIRNQGHAEEPQTAPGNFREASYVVMFIAAVFVVNALETGSYRTPWPVAAVAALVGLGLFIYSLYLQSSSEPKK